MSRPKIVQVTDVQLIRLMCGKITCKHCGNVQSAAGWHHDREALPLKEYAFRCNACGNPFPPPPENPL